MPDKELTVEEKPGQWCYCGRQKDHENQTIDCHPHRARRRGSTMTNPTPDITACGVANPSGSPCTRAKGHAGGHDLAAYGPSTEALEPTLEDLAIQAATFLESFAGLESDRVRGQQIAFALRARVSAPSVAPVVDGKCSWTWNRDTEYEGFWIAECKEDEDWPIKIVHDGARFCTFCGRGLLVKGEE